jgi:hypothetical protein
MANFPGIMELDGQQSKTYRNNWQLFVFCEKRSVCPNEQDTTTTYDILSKNP